MSENTFEFECQCERFHAELKKRTLTVRYADGVLCDSYGSQTSVYAMVDILLRERTARADVFARLMEVAKRMNEKLANPGTSYTPELDALQAEWERGGT